MPFTTIDTTYTPPSRLVIADWGKEKVGKTSFALTAPSPILMFNFDYGYRPVLSFAEGKEVQVANYILPDQFSVASYRSIMNQFQKDWADGVATAADRGGTCIVDTASQLWQVIGECMTGEVREERAESNELRAAEGGRQAKDSRLDWRKANATMDAILKRPLTVAGKEQANVVYIQRAAPVYDGSQDTGKVKMHGFGTTGSIVEVVVYMDVIEAHVDPKTMKPVPAQYVARIDFSRYQGQTLRGMQLTNPTWDKLMNLVA